MLVPSDKREETHPGLLRSLLLFINHHAGRIPNKQTEVLNRPELELMYNAKQSIICCVHYSKYPGDMAYGELY